MSQSGLVKLAIRNGIVVSLSIDLSSIPSLQPTRLKFRYQREGRRLSVKGSDCVRDMVAIKGLIRRGLIPRDLEAITHMAPSGVISIFRAHRLAEWIGGC